MEHIRTHVATKTVNLSEDAYERLKALKREGESFSDVVNRLTGKHALLDLVGILDEGEARELRDHVEEARERMRADLEERTDRLDG